MLGLLSILVSSILCIINVQNDDERVIANHTILDKLHLYLFGLFERYLLRHAILFSRVISAMQDP